MKKIIYVLATLGLLLSAGLAGASLLNGKPDSHRVVYETAPVTKGIIQKNVATSGTVRPRMTVQVGSELSGRVKSIVADFNATVKAGDLLAVIDPKTFESKANQARADLVSAQAAVVNAEAAVRKASSVLTNAGRVNDRQLTLGRKGLASGANMDSSERDLNVARAEVDVAQANLENAKAVVAQKTAQLEQAMIDLERTQIRAPIGGIVLHRAVDVGQTVAASFQAPELFRLAGDLSSIHIEAQVSESDIGAVRRGQSVAFDVDAHPGRTFRGRVEQVRLSPLTAESVVTYTVIIEADNARMELFPGMTANVRIETAKRDDVLRVATDAIRFKPPRQSHAASNESATLWDRGKALLRGAIGLAAEPAPTAEPGDDEKNLRRVAETREALIQRWARRLKLDERQVAELTRRTGELTKVDTKPARDRSAEKAQGRKRPAADEGPSPFEAVLEQILTPEQRTRLAAIKAEREGTQRATVWLMGKDGSLERRSIRVGLSDVQHVELASNELQPGEEVIVRSRKAKAQ